jgi:hypothetical protein
MRIVALRIREDFDSDSPVWRFREKNGKHEPWI